MELPRTLHGQLYLLAYDHKKRRFHFDDRNSWKNEWRFEFALRSAMLTDLYLGGYIEDRNGEAAVLISRHDDPLLQTALGAAAGRGWSQLVRRGGATCRDVCEQLEAAGWIRQERRPLLGRARRGVYDENMVDALGHRVTEALTNILGDRHAHPPALAVGLIAVQAQLPVVSRFIDDAHDRDRLREMTFATIEPILALYNAIHRRHEENSWGRSGGCGGGGCGGGGGG